MAVPRPNLGHSIATDLIPKADFRSGRAVEHEGGIADCPFSSVDCEKRTSVQVAKQRLYPDGLGEISNELTILIAEF